MAGPSAPPLSPPVDAPLPTGAGMTSIGPFLLTPTLDTYYILRQQRSFEPNHSAVGAWISYSP